MYQILLRKVSVNFGSVHALVDIDLEVSKGEYVVILGPSGAGKTTLLRVLAGLIKPSSGNIFFDNIDITNYPPEKRNIAYLPQNYALFPKMNVWDNITYAPKLQRQIKDRINELGNEILDMMHLSERPDAYPHELSGGMKQRTALGRSLAANSKILLLDEPLRALDARLRLELRNELLKLTQDLGLTVLHVTHDQDEAMNIADRLVILNKGHILQIGTQEEIYLYPKDDFVCSFVGETISFSSYVTNMEKISEKQISKLIPLYDKEFYHYYFEYKEGNISKKIEIITPNIFGIGEEVQIIVKTENIRLTKIKDFKKKISELNTNKDTTDKLQSLLLKSSNDSLSFNSNIDITDENENFPDLSLYTNTFLGKIINSFYLGKWTTFEIQMQDISAMWKVKLTSRKATRFKIGDFVVLQILKEFAYAFKFNNK